VILVKVKVSINVISVLLYFKLLLIKGSSGLSYYMLSEFTHLISPSVLQRAVAVLAASSHILIVSSPMYNWSHLDGQHSNLYRLQFNGNNRACYLSHQRVVGVQLCQIPQNRSCVKALQHFYWHKCSKTDYSKGINSRCQWDKTYEETLKILGKY